MKLDEAIQDCRDDIVRSTFIWSTFSTASKKSKVIPMREGARSSLRNIWTIVQGDLAELAIAIHQMISVVQEDTE